MGWQAVIKDYTTMPTWGQFDLTRLLSWGLNWNASVTLMIRAAFKRMDYNYETAVGLLKGHAS